VEDSREPFSGPVSPTSMARDTTRWPRPFRDSRSRIVMAVVSAVALAGAAVAIGFAWPRSQTLPPAPAPGYESPASAVAGYTAGLFTEHPAAACRYTAPSDRALCTMVVTAGAAEARMTGSWTIGHTVTSGRLAIVDVEYRAREAAKGTSMVNTDPDAGLPHAGLSFVAAYRQVFSSESGSFATDCVLVDGRWYVDDVQQGLG
jgi:hypothetical protein